MPALLQPGQSLICRKETFLVAQKSVTLEIAWQKRLGAGFFGGEGFILQKVTGPGVVWLDLSGELVERDLAPGERLLVHAGHVGVFEPSVSFDIQMVSGFRNILFGGEGLFLATLTGPGHLWLQSMPILNLAEEIGRYLPGVGSDTGANSTGGHVRGGRGDRRRGRAARRPVRRQRHLAPCIPANAGIQRERALERPSLDSRLRGNDELSGWRHFCTPSFIFNDFRCRFVPFSRAIRPVRACPPSLSATPILSNPKFTVIPANAGIQRERALKRPSLDSRLRGKDRVCDANADRAIFVRHRLFSTTSGVDFGRPLVQFARLRELPSSC